MGGGKWGPLSGAIYNLGTEEYLISDIRICQYALKRYFLSVLAIRRVP